MRNDRSEYSVIGEAVNLASQLQEWAGAAAGCESSPRPRQPLPHRAAARGHALARGYVTSLAVRPPRRFAPHAIACKLRRSLMRGVYALLLATGCGVVKPIPDAASPPDAAIKCNDGVRAPGEVCFGSTVLTQTATVIDAQLADADDDGDLDLGFVLGDKLAVQLQQAGTFGAAITGVTRPATFLVVRDLTGDRKADFIAVGPGGPTELETLVGDGAGGQQPVYVDRTAGVSHGLAMANIDGAGPDELVQFDDAKVQVFSVSTAAVLELMGTAIASSGLTAGAAGRVDGDALADVVIAVPGGVVLQRGGVLGLGAAEPVGVTASVTALAIGDVDGDGKPDVVYATDGMIGVMRGNGAGGFTAAPTRAIPGAGKLLVLADIDGDGRADVISPNGAMLEIALGQADGSLGELHEIALPGKPDFIHADMDVNGDHAPDIVVTSGMTITILTSQP